MKVMFTWIESLDFRALAAAMRASKPPSEWPTRTTDLNPNSWQNAKSRSTCAWRSYGFGSPFFSHSDLLGLDVKPQPGLSNATTRHPTSIAMEPITCRHENTPPPNPWSSTTPVSFSYSSTTLESPSDTNSKLSNTTDGFCPPVCCPIAGHPVTIEGIANRGEELLSKGAWSEEALPEGFHASAVWKTGFMFIAEWNPVPPVEASSSSWLRYRPPSMTL